MELSTSSDTYYASSRIRSVRSQEQSSQAPNHCRFAFLPLEHYFLPTQSSPLIFLPHMEQRPDSVLSEVAGIARAGTVVLSKLCLSGVILCHHKY